ncbi:MAG: hypothetical protein MZV64_04490 [Ignavibacteriales bacterium]|nr:hypothetical protein [Ignavibacteriales bacterium]
MYELLYMAQKEGPDRPGKAHRNPGGKRDFFEVCRRPRPQDADRLHDRHLPHGHHRRHRLP